MIRLILVTIQRVMRRSKLIHGFPLDILRRYILEAQDPAMRSRLQRAPFLVAKDADQSIDIAGIAVPARINLEGSRIIDVGPAVIQADRLAGVVIKRGNLGIAGRIPLLIVDGLRIRADIIANKRDVLQRIPHRTEHETMRADRVQIGIIALVQLNRSRAGT